MKLFDPTRHWPLFVICGLAGIFAALSGSAVLYVVLGADASPTTGWTVPTRLALMALVLLTGLPVAIAAAVLTRRGRNRTAALLLLAVPTLTALLTIPEHEVLKIVTKSLILMFAASILTALWGPRRSHALAGAALALYLVCFTAAYTPDYLHYRLVQAAERSDTAGVARLLRWGVDAEPGTGPRITPLRFAVEHGNDDMVRLLLEHGASPYLRDGDGVSPMMRAIELGHTEITLLLLGRAPAPPPPPLPDASEVYRA